MLFVSKMLKSVKKNFKKIIPQECKPKIFGIYKAINTGTFVWGSGKVCPLCGKEYRKFLPFPDLKGIDSQCPNCGSLARHRLLWLYMVNNRILEESGNILHFAPNLCIRMNIEGISNSNYLTTDLDDNSVDVTADITNLPFKDNYFDLIICSHVLEHIKKDYTAMEELYRVSSLDGRVLIMVPILQENTFEDSTVTDPEARKEKFGQHNHVRICGEDYPNRLREVGFNVSIFQYAKSFAGNKIQKFGLNRNNNMIYIIECFKQD